MNRILAVGAACLAGHLSPHQPWQAREVTDPVHSSSIDFGRLPIGRPRAGTTEKVEYLRRVKRKIRRTRRGRSWKPIHRVGRVAGPEAFQMASTWRRSSPVRIVFLGIQWVMGIARTRGIPRIVTGWATRTVRHRSDSELASRLPNPGVAGIGVRIPTNQMPQSALRAFRPIRSTVRATEPVGVKHHSQAPCLWHMDSVEAMHALPNAPAPAPSENAVCQCQRQ